MLFFPSKDPIVKVMQATLSKLQSNDPATLALLNADTESSLAGLAPEDRRTQAIAHLKAAIAFAATESEPDNHTFHSRDALTGITQTTLAAKLTDDLPDDLEDTVIPALQAYGQDNPVVWIPTGIDAILEYFKPKAAFKTATPAKSQITLPDTCKVALLSDWGADNEHAQRLGKLAIERGADFVIHLGDIYYSGAQSECQTFLNNWPLKQADGTPIPGRSFALNGNHEMYSLGRYYFTTVLDGFGQEASYFTLANQWWQIQGIDTAYVPFSIDGNTVDPQGKSDANVKPQWDWLLNSIQSNPGKKNIFLSHHQPTSAHLMEFEQSYNLGLQYRQLLELTQGNAIFAWFFGHEHRCTICDDTKTDFKARLIGNGSIPHQPQEDVPPEKDDTGAGCTPTTCVNTGAIDGGPVAISTFALLSFNQGTCTVDYINEDGTPFYQTETWQ